jgi:FkbM family methyltransferase
MKKLLLALLLLVVAAIAIFPQARMAGLVLMGRGNSCTVTRAWEIGEHWSHMTQVKDRILAASKKLDQDKGLQLWDTPYGKFWIPNGNEYVLPFNLAEQELKIYGKVGELGIHKDDVVLDCGANVGVYTREALLAGARTIVAIEPEPDNVECLRRNFAPEIASGRVILVPKGVWDKDDFLEMSAAQDNMAAATFVLKQPGAKPLMKVALLPIDELVQELKLDRVDFIKMDIEGAEVKAVAGAKQTIAKYHPRMALSVYHEPDHPVEVPRQALAAYPGYRTECGPCNTTGWSVRPDVIYFF